MISGLYQGQDGDERLELRVDVDGIRPTGRVSGDLFSGTSYTGSFVVAAPAVRSEGGRTTVSGTGVFTHQVTDPAVRVVIGPDGASAAVAGREYALTFTSRFFRSVLLEQDSVVGAVPFVSYDTGSLPGPTGSPARHLSVPAAYAEAGIELRLAQPGVVPVGAAGADLAWDDAELHHAMTTQFSQYGDAAAWRVWLLVASRHVGGYRGIMFDYADAYQRQGAAVFHDAVKGTSPQAQRAQLRTYVHELGHAFNLMHSWQKNLARPPQPLGPSGGFGDLSWMNYVQNYRPGGEPGYWAAFPFQFTDAELVHLRHGFFRDVAMGANAFGTGAADIDPFEQQDEEAGGLRLSVRAKESFAFGEPVVVELKLWSADGPATTHGHLHPDTEFTQVCVRGPDGDSVLYRPMLRHCVDDAPSVTLGPARYDSAYIGHGRDGHYFQRPGEYRITAQYAAADGSRVVSPPCVIRVAEPVSADDRRVAELLLGEEQGTLLSLLGSDSPRLRAGNDALEEVIERHGAHPLAVYARLVTGLNAERGFKDLSGGRLRVRAADAELGVRRLGAVVREGGRIDNITLNLVMRRLARAEARQGEFGRAHAVMDAMVARFAAQDLSPAVMGRIRQEAERTKAELSPPA
ncbi:hypothetical protein [Nonomuraea longicatena]|uniref:Uncharacterized protein n=1 Tax=Nonomuraea longicatena TaxID=83682 RepID=A0ABP3ZYJ6_9ACTN